MYIVLTVIAAVCFICFYMAAVINEEAELRRANFSNCCYCIETSGWHQLGLYCGMLVWLCNILFSLWSFVLRPLYGLDMSYSVSAILRHTLDSDCAISFLAGAIVIPALFLYAKSVRWNSISAFFHAMAIFYALIGIGHIVWVLP